MNATTRSAEGSEARLVRVLDDYLAALARGEAPDRSALLADHPDIAADLEACLASLEFIRHADPSAGPTARPAADLDARDASHLGDFRIVREVGRGGMGVVYEAEQLSLGRRVALKVLPFAAALDSRQLQRFRLEAQAAAQLHHTHIVPVYSVGVERGVHYYAMQFIDGRSLAEVLDDLRRSEGLSPKDDGPSDAPRPPSPFPPPGSSIASRPYFQAVARLGIQAAEALEYAHSLGVVHRDIKPANLLLDARGELWVADFGLARVIAEAGPTLSGDVLGTLRYASPEQALALRAVLDHRADIYSLGATLYELLTLRPALDGRDSQELLRQIAFDEPPAPRRLASTIPADLETVVLKAMAKEPESRYASSQELADDLHRFLEQMPIRAKRPALVARAGKWARRHPSALASAAIFLVLAVIGLSVGAALIWEEQGQTAKALLAESRQRRLLGANLVLALKALDEIYLTVAETRLMGPGQIDPRDRELLQKALRFYER
jgi:serine/threonine protein kinase